MISLQPVDRIVPKEHSGTAELPFQESEQGQGDNCPGAKALRCFGLHKGVLKIIVLMDGTVITQLIFQSIYDARHKVKFVDVRREMMTDLVR